MECTQVCGVQGYGGYLCSSGLRKWGICVTKYKCKNLECTRPLSSFMLSELSVLISIFMIQGSFICPKCRKMNFTRCLGFQIKVID